MKRFIFTIPVQTYEMYTVDARTFDEALEVVLEGEGKPVYGEIPYEVDRDSNNWTVEEKDIEEEEDID